MVYRWVFPLLVGAVGLVWAQGVGDGKAPAPKGEGAPSVVRLDAGATPLPLPSVLRSLAASAGYAALVADVPEDRKVVVRKLELPLEEALRFLVGTYLGEDYGYGILRERKLVVVAKKRNLEALVKGALEVDLVPKKEEAKEGGASEAKAGKEAKGKAEAIPAYRVFPIPNQVDPDSLQGLTPLFPSLRVVFLRAVSGPLLVVSGPEEDLGRFVELWGRLEEGWKASMVQPPQAPLEDRLFPLPQGAKREEVEAFLGAASPSAKVQVFPKAVYCRGTAEECARVGKLLEAAFPEETPSPPPPAPSLLLHAYPLYGNPEELAEVVRQTMGKRIEEAGGTLQLAKESRQLVVKAPIEVHKELYALLEQVDRPPVRPPVPNAQAVYRSLYVEAPVLVAELKARFPELKVEVREGRVIWEGAPEVVRQAAALVQSLDRPKPQVVYRVIVFSTNDRYVQDLNASLALNLRSGLELSIEGLLRAGGILPPTPNAASSLSATLEMAERKGWGKSVLNTTLVAVDGEETFLQSGGKVSVLQGGSSQGSSGSGSGSGQNPSSSSTTPLEYDYGLILRVKPKVLSSELVQTTVALEISDEPTLSTNVLRYARKRTEGQYLIPPGGILAIGGVVASRESRSKEGIPLLMDIPLLGSLFSKENRTVTSEYLLIYLVPETVSYPPSQAEPPAFRQGGGEAPVLPARKPPTEPKAQGVPAAPKGKEAPAEAEAKEGARVPQASQGGSPEGAKGGGEAPRLSPKPVRAELRPASQGTLLRLLGETSPLAQVRVGEAWYRLLPSLGGFWAVGAPLEYGKVYEAKLADGQTLWVVFQP